jgi:hypothetical protein
LNQFLFFSFRARRRQTIDSKFGPLRDAATAQELGSAEL